MSLVRLSILNTYPANVGSLLYLGSDYYLFPIPNSRWRYRAESNTLFTVFFEYTVIYTIVVAFLLACVRYELGDNPFTI